MNFFRFYLIILVFFVQQTKSQDELNMKVIGDENCDKSVIQQLNEQNIIYFCQENNIMIGNQDKIAFDLNLKDQNLFSRIIIYNIKVASINNLILENIQFYQNDAFIYFNQIQDLEMLNISISKSMKSFYMLFNSDYITSITIKQIILKDIFIQKIKFQSYLIYINQISLINSQICSLNLIGDGKLAIKNYQKILNASFTQFEFTECPDSVFQSKQEINIESINLDLSYINISPTQIFNVLSFFVNSVQGKIKIDLISYQSSFVTNSYIEVIQFNSDLLTKQRANVEIDKLIYQNNDSNSSLYLDVKSLQSFFINELILEGLSGPIQYSRYQSLFKIFNTGIITIWLITIKNCENIKGPIFQVLYSQEIKTKLLILENSVIYSSFIVLEVIIDLTIENFQIRNIKFYGYLINAQQIYNLYFRFFILSESLINSKSLFNLKNINRSVFGEFAIVNVNTDQKQSMIFYYVLEPELIMKTILFRSSQANLQTENNLQFLTLDGSNYHFTMSKSKIINGSSINFGGCLNFINTFDTIQNQVIEIWGTTFQQCRSNYLGGAISGTSFIGIYNYFIECSSQIGGAIYVVQGLNSDIDQDHNKFQQNKAYLAANTFNKSPLKLKILEILEINQINFNDKNLFTQTNQYLYPGLTYVIRLSLEVDGEQHNEYTNNNNFGNLYQLLVSPSQNFISQTPNQLYSINFPFILWSAKDISFSGKQEIELEAIQIYLAQLYTLKESQYKVYNGCKEQGMEKVYLDKYSRTQFICQYCEQMKVSYYGVCQQCQVEYFQQCYGNYSELKSSYWRSIYSAEPQDIYYCSNNPSSCQGGSGIGNELCYEGHVGAQCLDCDLYGTYWNERFSKEGFFQCVKCSSISSNTIKIIVLLTILMLSLPFILYSTFKKLKNEILALYLSKMGIFFIRKTLQQQTLTSTYIKILLFHTQIYFISNQFTKVNILSTLFNFQFLFYNPLSSSFLSLNCLISQYKPESTNIGYTELLLTFIIPIFICSLTIIVSFCIFILKRKLFIRSLYMSILTFIYMFMIVFYSILLEKTLSSFFCLKLDKDKYYSLIDLSLECGNSSELYKIQCLSLVILILFLVVFPFVVFAKLIQSRKRLNKVKVKFTFGFLYIEYKTKFFYWEMVRIFVKSLIILFYVYLKQYPQISLTTISIILFCYVMALKSFNPFISSFLNNLEIISTIISNMILLSSTMYLQQNQNGDNNFQDFKIALYLIIQLCNMMFFFYCIWLIIMSFLEKYIQKLQKCLKWRCIQRLKSTDNMKINKNVKKMIICMKKMQINQKLDDSLQLLLSYELQNDLD
ncbi:transmembrane protein, putative (macronuclear) [Tetrahymena thermophila SB210]|uniref:Transmembrane protein, putative n=1 Tax=Tetrahymena thermophila (strain SB210) TaxID=312017 RepID=Q22SR5_TETTS|nr:transmembrane protein, putative [Tetrahymena thermophila SB210]EAR88310.3 transmembrane protein, putative [Tetrahymena thermophila SB210]|eukprot:XP_001008555.3 transmembrane protein, putative [Tetrahymena thermophila SB210]